MPQGLQVSTTPPGPCGLSSIGILLAYFGPIFPGSTSGKEPACSRDWGSVPGSERSPGGGHGNPLQYACLENSMDREAWQGLQKVRHNWSDLARSTHGKDHCISSYKNGWWGSKPLKVSLIQCTQLGSCWPQDKCTGVICTRTFCPTVVQPLILQRRQPRSQDARPLTP